MRPFAPLLFALIAALPAAPAAAQNLQPFAFSTKDMASQTCALPGALPKNVKVLAAGAYGGKRTGFQIDQSGHEATQIDVAVNAPGRPVVLMLGAYEPTIWHIGWSARTKIVGVLVSGYHRQTVAGLPRQTPVINSSYDNRGPCGYFYVQSENRDAISPLALRVFGHPVDQVYLSRNGKVVVGDMLDERTRLLTSGDVTIDSLRPVDVPLAGEPGLEAAVLKGALRPATADDVLQWDTARQAQAQAESDAAAVAAPVTGAATMVKKDVKRRNLHHAYVVLKPLTAPAGLYGSHAAIFFVPIGAPLPTGDLGHSALLDFNTMRCTGALCSMADPTVRASRENKSIGTAN